MGKKTINLLDYITSSGAQVVKVGANTYRVEPCPVCGHKDHFTVYQDTESYFSFSGCCQGGSIIDYLMEVEGMDKSEAMSKAGDLKPGPVITRLDKVNNKLEKETRLLIDGASKNTSDYYYTRGLTDKTINKYRLGYLPSGHKLGKSFKYVLPVSDTFCILRSDNETDRYRNIGSPEPLNLKYLTDPDKKELFIVEGYIDALSLEEIDLAAIALNSTSGYKALIEAIETHQEALRDKTLYLIPDNDEAGLKTADSIGECLKHLGIKYTIDFIDSFKDVNEALLNSKQDLITSIEQIIKTAKDTEHQGTVYEYLADSFELDQARRLTEPDIKTGFDSLDRALGRGLYPGLYILGAISSLGKTSLALQIADTIAEQGHPVIFYSLEMGRHELVCRSLTREYFKLTKNENITTGNVIRPTAESDIFRDPDFIKARDIYREGPAKNLYLVEGDFKTTIDKIEGNIRGHRPIIIIDYLQVIQPTEGSRLSDKQHVDQIVVRLKQLSRRLDLPVLAVSSFNRASYSDEAGPSMAAFKESGAIEYGADVLLYMQLRKGKDDDLNEVKNRQPRPIDLVILKNRRGLAYEEIKIDYYTKQNYMVEARR